MSVLTDAQKSSLFGRLLGLPESTNPRADLAPERVAPTGTVAGREPANSFNSLLMNVTQNQILMVTLGIIAVLAVVKFARR